MTTFRAVVGCKLDAQNSANFRTKRQLEGGAMKLIKLLSTLRESIIDELIKRIKEDGCSDHVIREVVTRKFDEL